MSMKDLYDLLKEYEESHIYHHGLKDEKLHRELSKDGTYIHIFWIPYIFTNKHIISNQYWFIQWLINEHKIRPSIVEQWAIVLTNYTETWVSERIIRRFWDVENVIKYLSVQWDPINVLLKLMRDSND